MKNPVISCIFMIYGAFTLRDMINVKDWQILGLDTGSSRGHVRQVEIFFVT